MDERVSAYKICLTTSERQSCSIKRTKPVRVSVRARLLKQHERSRSIERNVFLFAISCALCLNKHNILCNEQHGFRQYRSVLKT